MELLVLIIVVFMVSLLSLATSVWALIEILGMKSSTHKVQYMPVENSEATTGKDLLQKLHPELLDGEDYA